MQGSGGGPSEGNVSGHILKSAGQPWKEDSLLAVDAGVHLSGIISILDDHKRSNTQSPQDGATLICPFSEADLPFKSSRANAGHILRELVSSFLITHSHLDHISGLAIATAALKNVKKSKRIAALPHTITALRKHIFNDFIWPNLSDEDGGVGLISYLRLPEAARDYIWVAEGLGVQAWPVSHGHCMRKHNHRGSNAGLRASISSAQGLSAPVICEQPCVFDSTTYFIRDEITFGEVLMWGDVEPDSISLSPRNYEVWAVAAKKLFEGKLRAVFIECSFDNTQPDACLYGHLGPRHLYDELTTLAKQVILLREEAAQDALLQREASTDIEMDMELRPSNRKRKRMSVGWGDGQRIPERRWEDGTRIIPEEPDGELVRIAGDGVEDESAVRRNSAGGVSPKCTASDPEGEPSEFVLSQPEGANNDQISVSENRDGLGIFGSNGHSTGEAKDLEIDFSVKPLDGLLIVVNHVKDTLEDDVDTVERIYANLQELEKKHSLGCTFVMAKKGLTIFF